MNNPIIVVGSLNMDLVVRSPRHPLPGETILGSDFRTFPGGKGANQAVAASRMGAEVFLIGRVGNDQFGDALINNLIENAVNVDHIYRDDSTSTGVALITVNSSGENTIIVDPGANAQLTPADILAYEYLFEAASALILQLESPLSVVDYSIKLAKKHNLTVVLNPAPAQPLSPELLCGVDYLIPNQTELSILSGNPDETQVILAAKQLQSNFGCSIIVTRGNEGSLVIDKDLVESLPSYSVDVVDSTAAGDAFVAAFTIALLEGYSTIDAARWGNAAGAITVTRYGAQVSLPTYLEVKQLLDIHQKSQSFDD